MFWFRSSSRSSVSEIRGALQAAQTATLFICAALFLISETSLPLSAYLGFWKSAVLGYLKGCTTPQKVVKEAIGTQRRSMGHKPSARQADAPEAVTASLPDFAARLAQHGALRRLLAHGHIWT